MGGAMKRVWSATVLSVVVAVLLATPSGAAIQWCRRDPVVRLNGTEVQILVAIPVRAEERVTGPIDFRMSVPAHVSRELVSVDPGFNGFGEEFSWTGMWDDGAVDPEGTFRVKIRVSVPMDGDVPMQVIVNPRNDVSQVFTGRTNRLDVAFRLRGQDDKGVRSSKSDEGTAEEPAATDGGAGTDKGNGELNGDQGNGDRVEEEKSDGGQAGEKKAADEQGGANQDDREQSGGQGAGEHGDGQGTGDQVGVGEGKDERASGGQVNADQDGEGQGKSDQAGGETAVGDQEPDDTRQRDDKKRRDDEA